MLQRPAEFSNRCRRNAYVLVCIHEGTRCVPTEKGGAYAARRQIEVYGEAEKEGRQD